jgi:predicted ATP-grasp superfamily ATP-dependent carboligase
MLADKTPTESRRCRYWQRRIEGSVCSAVFVAAGGKARILGVSRQLVGLDWCGAADFQYAGNIGPITLGEGLLQQLRSIGECLARCFPLCGLFGVDVVVDAQRVWTIEVNPRYCASVEIFERGLDTNFVHVHLAACLQGELPACPQPMPSRLHGKAVLYARRDSTLTASRLARLTEEITEPGGLVCLADLPSGPTRLRTGQPVLTVLAQGQDEPEVLTGLQKIAQRIYGILCGQSKF